ncbi:MAG: baeRF3 domain-containing protein [Chitinophagaceae bacterium]
MIKENLTGEDLLMLQNAKGNICVSIVVPTHRISPGRRADKLVIEKTIDKAKQLLHYKYPGQQIEPLLSSMDELFQGIDFLHSGEGIGLYISSNVKLSVQFPFPVEEKVLVADNFELRDLLYKFKYANPYLVLVLTENRGRLYEGSWNNLFEIKDNNFPMEYQDDYEYAKPVHSSSYAGYSHVKDFEKDKSELEVIRFRDFFKKMDKLLDNYLVKEKSLIIMGVEKELSLFSGISGHSKNIVDKIKGSHNYDNEKKLADIAWPAMRTNLENEWKKLVKEFEEKIGEGLGVTGIQDIWSAVKEGKAFKLLVEKDYKMPGFLTNNEYHLYVKPPKKRHKVIPDAVDDIIEMVMEKNGHVFFVDNGFLKDYNRMALIKRY